MQRKQKDNLPQSIFRSDCGFFLGYGWTMERKRTLRKSILAATMLALVMAMLPVRAHAVSKEMVQLQTQVQQLLDMVQRLQSTMDTRFAVL
jgi:hypothetical protein